LPKAAVYCGNGKLRFLFHPRGSDRSLLGIELYRIDAIIIIFSVATCNAAASGIAFLKLEQSFPYPVLHFVSDQPGLVDSMLAMAGPAGLPAFLLVYMKVMQI
jgi:hypothetical protein